MGNSIATAMVEKQKEMQQEMMQKQLKMQVRGQERMRRMMVASQMAMMREQLMWEGGFKKNEMMKLIFEGLLSFGLLGLAAYSAKNGFPKPAIIPITVIGTVVSYQIDFAYGNKAERINNMTKEILEDPSYWFVPALPDENAVLDIKPKETKKP